MSLAEINDIWARVDKYNESIKAEAYKKGYEQAKAEYDTKLEEVKSRFKDYYYKKGYEVGKKDSIKWIPFTAESAPKEDGLYFVKCKTETGRVEISADRYSTAYCEWFIHENDTVIEWMLAPKEE